MCVKALRKIQKELEGTLANPDGIDPDIVRTAARQIGAQAESMELGL